MLPEPIELRIEDLTEKDLSLLLLRRQRGPRPVCVSEGRACVRVNEFKTLSIPCPASDVAGVRAVLSPYGWDDIGDYSRHTVEGRELLLGTAYYTCPGRQY